MKIDELNDAELMAWIKPYFGNKKSHKNYNKAKDVYWHMSFHADGYFKRPNIGTMQQTAAEDLYGTNPYFMRLIDMRRPSESDSILAYRRNVYRPFSQEPIYTVITSLQKIFKSEDYFVNYSKTETPPSLPEEFQLEKFCEENYPFWDSVSNWGENLALRWNLIDPNAICVVMPLDYEVPENELLNPFAHIIQSKDVYDYRENEYAVFLSPYVNVYTTDEGVQKNGKIVVLVTPTCFYEAKQVADDKFIMELKLQHNIGTLPAFVMKGECVGTDPIAPFYESFLKPMLPNLDELASVSSDASAEIIQHMYSEKWYIMGSVCKDCNGEKSTIVGGKQVVCPSCQGRGVAPKSPYQDLIINPNNAFGQPNGQNLPTPPAGYITKDTKIVELLLDIMDRHAYKALSSVHMQLLWNNPLSRMKESGIAKAYNQSETDNFVHKIAYNLIKNVIDQVYYYTNEIRYSTIVPDRATREKMLPTIAVPKNYDIITQQAIEDNLKNLDAANVSPVIKHLVEMQYLHMKFPDNIMRDKLQLSYELNPFQDKTIEEKIALMNCDGVEKVDVVLSIYIESFISQLLSEDASFVDYDFIKQKEIVYKLAADKLASIEDYSVIDKLIDEKRKQNAIEEVPVKKENDKLDPSVKPRKAERNELENS